jgi:glucoamylase
VWFTLLNGGISEVYYPTLDTMAVNRLRFLVGSGKKLVDEEQNLHPTVSLADPHALAFTVTATDSKHGFRLEKTIITDPARDALVMQVKYTALTSAAKKFALYLDLEPALGNSSLGNTIQVSGARLDASDGTDAMTLATSAPVRLAATGYRDFNDPLTQIAAPGKVAHRYTVAKHGRVAGLLSLAPGSKPFTVVLAFGHTTAAAESTATAALHAPFAATLAAYVTGWGTYCNGLFYVGGLATGEWYESAMTIKAAEDKTYEGAIVASPTHPFGQTTADDGSTHGYVLVWPRDLYHSAMGLLAAGDQQTAREALNFLVKARNPDGSEPQNAHVDGKPFWTGVQMDEASDAVLLAWRLNATDVYSSLVLPTARFIASNGPSTQQERWEEAGGYSPATIAAEIAALTAAAVMASHQGDDASAQQFLATADSWERQIENWTYTTTGPLGDHQYYLRLAPTGQPDTTFPLALANGGGTFDQREIVDPSFLELVRLGVRSAHDPHILSTLPVVDSVLESMTPLGPDWHRYNHDGYGDPNEQLGPGVGHTWPVFDGERGMYDVAAGDLAGAQTMLHTIEGFAGPTGLIPEQVFEKTGQPTSSADPLIWAQGEYLVLARSIADGTPFDRPSVAFERYGKG